VRERFLRDGIDRGQIAVTKGAFQPTDFVDDTALLLGCRQMGCQRGRQPGTAITHDHLDSCGIQSTPDYCGQQVRPGGGIFGSGHLIFDKP
jgi:hypothetical protein